MFKVTQVSKNGMFGASTFQNAVSEDQAIEFAKMYGMKGKLVAERV